jgi:hypothetical protein
MAGIFDAESQGRFFPLEKKDGRFRQKRGMAATPSLTDFPK